MDDPSLQHDELPEDPLLREAEEIFCEWLMDHDDPGRVPFDRLCAQHPRHATALERLQRQDEAMQRLAARMGAGGGGRSGELDASRVKTKVRYESDESPSDAWTKGLLARIRGRSLGVGKYHVSRRLGAGSMGEVLKAWDSDLQRFVALKLMRHGPNSQGINSTDQATRRAHIRFVEEAQVTAQLDHPNIVPVHDFGVTSDGRAYFTMNLVKGREFTDIIKLVHDPSSPWTVTRALGILLKACEAISYAHDKGVVHRDLKPANMMVGRFGAVYVMDWGLARVENAAASQIRLASGEMTVRVKTRSVDDGEPVDPLRTQDGKSIGTPYYMSPEQAHGQRGEVGPPSDVYGLGAILYHLLAGVPPYHTEGRRPTGPEVVDAIKRGPTRSLSEIASNVPADLRAIVGRAMERHPLERHPSVAAFSEDLISFIEGRVVGQGGWRPTHAARGARRWLARNKLAAALAVALIASLLWPPCAPR